MAAINNKKCPFCKEKIKHIDYKNLKVLSKFVTSFGKITPKYYSGVCLTHQKRLANAIKRARNMCLIPYTK
jgi:small subunit ribosomal protein S18